MKTLVRIAATLLSIGVVSVALAAASGRAFPRAELSSVSAYASVPRTSHPRASKHTAPRVATPAPADGPVAADPTPAGEDDSPDLGVVARADLPTQDRDPDAADPDAWVRPMWYPPTSEIEALPMMSAEGPRKGPSVRARSAFIYDLDAGRVLFQKNADDIRPVASITKLVSSLTFMSLQPNLDSQMCVTSAQYPSRNGARSHLSTGDCMQGWDVIGAALVASDNRAAIGLAAAAGTDVGDFVEHMNEVSEELGMESSSWADPSGLEDENLSTARDIAKATVAVASHPLLSMVASAPFWDVVRIGKQPRRLFSTDHMLGRDDVFIEAAKTGYTDTAHYCFTTVLDTPDGRRVVVTLLGADGKQTRWADMNRILAWLKTA